MNVRRSVRVGALLGLMFVPGFWQCRLESAANPEVEERASESLASIHRLQLLCGVNSAYLLLGIHSTPVSYDEVEKRLPIGPRGVSMLQMRDGVKQLGLEVELRRYEPEEMVSKLPFDRGPMIIHMRLSRDSEDADGHYVVAIGYEGQSIVVLDGTTGAVHRYKRHRFPIFCSGYVLQSSASNQNWRVWLIATNIAVWVCIGVAIWSVMRRVPKCIALRKEALSQSSHENGGHCRDDTRSMSLMLLFGFVCGLSGPSGLVAAETPGSDSSQIQSQVLNDGELANLLWRSPANDGPICLYLQWGALGLPIERLLIAKMIKSQEYRWSLKSIKDVAEQHGVRMQIVKCNISELSTIPMPAIIHLSSSRGDGGSLGLLYRVPEAVDGKYGVVDGGSATISELSADVFRRNWSGFALVPDRHRSFDRLSGLYALASVGLLGLWWYSRRRFSKSYIARCVRNLFAGGLRAQL